MQLTGKEIIERGILTNVDLEHAVQQQGVDLRVVGISEVVGVGYVPAEGKTVLPDYRPVSLVDEKYWNLEPGYYEITFAEGCKMPSDLAMTFVQRSSLLRCGVIIRSSQFDAGFETDQMGSFMQVFRPVKIGYGARVAQTLVMETREVSKENLYAGQFQQDLQRGTQG